jgi:hypothetical protein
MDKHGGKLSVPTSRGIFSTPNMSLPGLETFPGAAGGFAGGAIARFLSQLPAEITGTLPGFLGATFVLGFEDFEIPFEIWKNPLKVY